MIQNDISGKNPGNYYPELGHPKIYSTSTNLPQTNISPQLLQLTVAGIIQL